MGGWVSRALWISIYHWNSVGVSKVEIYMASTDDGICRHLATGMISVSRGEVSKVHSWYLQI